MNITNGSYTTYFENLTQMAEYLGCSISKKTIFKWCLEYGYGVDMDDVDMPIVSSRESSLIAAIINFVESSNDDHKQLEKLLADVRIYVNLFDYEEEISQYLGKRIYNKLTKSQFSEKIISSLLASEYYV